MARGESPKETPKRGEWGEWGERGEWGESPNPISLFQYLGKISTAKSL